jgi:peroxiredoxin
MAIVSVRYDVDTVAAGQKKDIIYELGDDLLSFGIGVMTTDTFSSSAQQYNVEILNTRSKEIVITQEGKLKYELTSEEKTVARYSQFSWTKDFWKLDTVIHANSNNMVAPDLIYLSICNIDVPADTIRKYYNMLSPEIRSSGFGKRIIDHLENRGRLAIGKTFTDFELPDTTGKIVRLKDIRSDYILLDFWFSQCGACIMSFPAIEKLYWATKRSKLEIIGISIDKKAYHELWQENILRYYMAWINLNDFKRKVTGPLLIEGYPTRILLNKDRKIVLLDMDNSQDDFFEKVKKLASK